MHVIGLTGGISTGKSTVSAYMKLCGIPIVDADLVARKVVQPGETCYYQILDKFGAGIMMDNGEIDRAKLGQIIFQDASKRQQLNRIVHPTIRLLILEEALKYFIQGKRIVVLDTPLLFESGLHRWMHSTLVVYTPEAIQKQRLMQRDNLSDKDAQDRINSQMSIEQKRKLANFTIDNSGSIQETKKQVDIYLLGKESSFIYYFLFFIPCVLLYIGIKFVLWFDSICYKGIFKRKKTQ